MLARTKLTTRLISLHDFYHYTTSSQHNFFSTRRLHNTTSSSRRTFFFNTQLTHLDLPYTKIFTTTKIIFTILQHFLNLMLKRCSSLALWMRMDERELNHLKQGLIIWWSKGFWECLERFGPEKICAKGEEKYQMWCGIYRQKILAQDRGRPP